MKITWLGHSGFRIEIAGQTLLIDPWLTGNPMFEGHDRAAAIQGATGVLVSHGHFDHSADAGPICKELGIKVAGVFELANFLAHTHGIEAIPFHKGGTIHFGEVAVTAVHATHSSSFGDDSAPHYTGGEAGFILSGEGHTIYFSGDTDVMADMAIFADLHSPDIGIMACGGHFTMDQRRVAYAAKKFFDFKVIIPCHYRTFPLLTQDAEELKAALPEVDIREPEVMKPIEI